MRRVVSRVTFGPIPRDIDSQFELQFEFCHHFLDAFVFKMTKRDISHFHTFLYRKLFGAGQKPIASVILAKIYMYMGHDEQSV